MQKGLIMGRCRQIYLVLFVLGLVAACAEERPAASCITKLCAEFSSQTEAQTAYDRDKKCLSGLDRDNDGLACEDEFGASGGTGTGTPGSGASGCPTTSNCGCSNKTKTVCEASACCQWIVGTGCKCR